MRASLVGGNDYTQGGTPARRLLRGRAVLGGGKAYLSHGMTVWVTAWGRCWEVGLEGFWRSTPRGGPPTPGSVGV